MSLVQIILEGRKEDFIQKYSNKFSTEQLKEIIDKSDVLPGQNKYLNFLGKVVNPKNFNSDLNIVVKLLEKFSTVSSNLSMTDINQYEKIGILKKTLEDYDNRVRREIKTIDDADVIYEDNELTVVSPRTHKSSCYFGSGTKWCTTTSDSGHYDRYNQDGKLFYFISKTKPTSDPTYKVALLRKYNGEEIYYDASDNSFKTGWIFGSEKLEKIQSRITSYINTTFAEQVKIWSDINSAKIERDRLNRQAAAREQRRQLAAAQERREQQEWNLEDTDSDGLKANALFKYLVSNGDINELTEDIKNEIILASDEIERLQSEYDADENGRPDLIELISELESKIEEYSEYVDVYVLRPLDYNYFGLNYFENVLDDTEWAVGTESEFDEASKESVKNLLDDVGLVGFNQNFIENFIDTDSIENYIREFFESDVYESPESYLDDSDKEISGSQKQEIAKLRQEEIELEQLRINIENKKDNLDTDLEDWDEQYDELQDEITEIEERLSEILDEIESINDEPDGDYKDEAIEQAIESRVIDYRNNIESFVDNYIGETYTQWAINNDFIDEDALIEGIIEADGYGISLSSYDGDYNSEFLNGVQYYIIRTS